MPRGTRHLLPTALVLFAVTGAARAQPVEEPRALRRQYEELLRETDLRSGFDRWAILRDLGAVPSEEARDALWAAFRRRRTPEGERLLAASWFAAVADGPALARLAKRLKDPAGPFPVAVSYGLYRNRLPSAERYVEGEGLRDGGPAMQVACAMALGTRRLKMNEAAAALAAVYRAHRDDEKSVALVHEIVDALARYPAAVVADTMKDAAGHPDYRVRMAAARELGTAMLSDKHDVVRVSAARGAAAREDEEAVPALIRLLAQPELRVKRAAYRALKRISGKDLGLVPGAWRSWHKREADGDAKAEGSVTVSRYHGLEVLSERAVFLVDVSDSMQWPEKGRQRIDVARDELVRVLGKLGERTRFNVIAFHGEVRPWQRSRLKSASSRNVKRAAAWIRKLEMGPGTNVTGALAAAFAHEDVDLIFLLGDGAPNHEPLFALEARLHAWNRSRLVPVHTIALTLQDRGELPARHLRFLTQSMQRIAEATSGDYRLVRDLP